VPTAHDGDESTLWGTFEYYFAWYFCFFIYTIKYCGEKIRHFPASISYNKSNSVAADDNKNKATNILLNVNRLISNFKYLCVCVLPLFAV
jgi:hypothetical protein